MERVKTVLPLRSFSAYGTSAIIISAQTYCEGVFDRDDFERLAGQLSEISGHFILSINDTPGAREVLSRFAVEDVTTTYTIGSASGAGKKVTELIVRDRGA